MSIPIPATSHGLEARFDSKQRTYDAVLIVSFGGPEGPDDVMPFLDNVLRGRNVPESRKLEVAEHYKLFGGVSPINEQNRTLIKNLARELASENLHLPIYLGNRNWHPFFEDTIRTMARDGVKRAVACFPSGFSSYSSCRQYWENIMAAQQVVGHDAPTIDKVRAYYNHPRFVQAQVQSVKRALGLVPESERANTHLVFTAHSIPETMALQSDYAQQLDETSALVAAGVGMTNFTMAFQSRSGPPQIRWLAPDVNDCLVHLQSRGVFNVIVLPIGFLTDHIEVKFDLDVEAVNTARRIGINLIRAETIGSTPEFVTMLRELIQERMAGNPHRATVGMSGPHQEICPPSCCSLSPQSS